jgi:phage terminase large subunit-like protein
MKHKEWTAVLQYAEGIRDGAIIANKERKQAVDRFFRDLDNPAYDLQHDGPEFCIQIIEKTLCHQQGETITGEPLRGTPFLLQPWEKFIIYNLIGFYHAGTQVVRFHEALIYLPRKNGKTGFAAALAWALSLWYRKSGSKCYISSAALMQSLEAFNFLDYNVDRMGEKQVRGKKGGLVKVIDNNNEHSMEASFSDGSFFIRALAANPDAQDSLNANLCICDEIHAFREPKQYNLFKECQKAYTNKLLIGISTAGDDEQGFLGQRLKYCRQVLDGTIQDEQYFIFLCCANPGEDGEIDYTNPVTHEMANPSYGVTIRPAEILNDALQAQNDPQQRKDFFAKSLNVFTNAMKAWFDIEEFRRSDQQYSWTLEELARLPVNWYGGADLSRMYDLTAAALYGQYDGVDIVITHAFFPVTQAARKADEDHIPLFGWADDGWLTMCNAPTVNAADVVQWFLQMKRLGFRIRQVGHDRKFAGEEYFPAMKAAGFSVVDQPQYFYLKSQGFRHIEKAAKDGKLYYLHSDAYEYCVQNVRAVEKTDDAVQYEKIQPEHRIDLFDASVFACLRMIQAQEKSKKAAQWWNG